jgi:hypothetical protein
MSKSNKVEIPAPPTDDDVGEAPQMPDGSPDLSTATQVRPRQCVSHVCSGVWR